MPTLNAAARDTANDAITATYNTASLIIYEGATALVTHTMAGFGASTGGVKTANAVADATIASSTTTAADSAKLIAGSNEVTLTVGLSGSGAEVIMSSLQLVEGGTSTINSVTVTFPAS